MNRTSSDRCITYAMYQEALAEAKSRLAMVNEHYGRLGAYLVLACRGNQMEAGADLPKLMEDLPELFHENRGKKEIRHLLQDSGMDQVGRDKRIHELSGGLSINADFCIELRFRNLEYELIWRLQADELVDRISTPQTRASIRIVFTALARFDDDGKLLR